MNHECPRENTHRQRVLTSSETVGLCQRDALKGADDVVGAFGGEETFVVAGAEVPVRALVILVSINSPDTADHDQTTDPVVPKIADVMEAQIRSRVSAFEPDVIVEDELGQANSFLGSGRSFFAGRAGVISERPQFPFHVDDTAVIRRQFSFRYLSHKRRRFDVDLAIASARLSSRETCPRMTRITRKIEGKSSLS